MVHVLFESVYWDNRQGEFFWKSDTHRSSCTSDNISKGTVIEVIIPE